MLHLADYAEAIDATANNDVTALADDYLTIINNHFQLREPLNLYAAYVQSATLNRVRLDSPSIRLLGNPFIRPITVGTAPPTDPNMFTLITNPYRLKRGEEIAMQATAAPAMTEQFHGLIWLGDRIIPAPVGDVHWLRATSTGVATANAWTTVAYTMDQGLPPGEYALIGSECISTTGVAHRWIFQGTAWRPGALSATAVGNRTHKIFYEFMLGEWGRFINTNLPALQVLCTAADAAHTIWMACVRTRDFPLN